jgi:hypothetical protein
MEKMSLFHIILGIIINIAIYVTVLYTMIYASGDRMDKNLLAIGEGGRQIIFFGIPMIFLAILMCVAESVAHIVDEKSYPYVLYGIIGAVAVAGMILYNYFPKRLVVPFGIAGWVTSFSLIYWYFWFGPGAFGHHHGF